MEHPRSAAAGGPRLSAWIALAIAAGAAFYLAGLPLGLNLFDEGLGMVGSERAVRGDFPYADFWTIYGPAAHFLFGGWMSVFGFTLLSARALTALLLLGSALALFWIGRRLARPAVGLAAFLIALVWFAANPVYARALAPAYLALFAGFGLTLRYFREGKGSPYLLGLVAGALALFRHDWGFCLCLGLAAAFVVQFMREPAPRLRFPALGRFLRRLLSCAAGVLTLLVPTVLFLLSRVPARDLYAQLIGVHFGSASAQWALPFPIPFLPRPPAVPPFKAGQILVAGWEGIAFYVPLAVFLAAGWRVLRGRERRPGLAEFLAAAAVCGIFLYTQLYHRSDMEHAIPPILIAVMLLGLVFSGPVRRSKSVAAVGLLLFIASLPLYRCLQSFALYVRDDAVRMTLPRSRGIVTKPILAADLQKAVVRVQALVPPGERIFVGCHYHDRIQFNDAMFYFLAARLPATRYHELPRGIATTEKVQREIIAELSRGPVRCVVLFESPLFDDPMSFEPNQSRFSSGVRLLDDYIAAHYRQAAAEGKYRILVRLDGGAADGPSLR